MGTFPLRWLSWWLCLGSGPRWRTWQWPWPGAPCQALVSGAHTLGRQVRLRGETGARDSMALRGPREEPRRLVPFSLLRGMPLSPSLSSSRYTCAQNCQPAWVDQEDNQVPRSDPYRPGRVAAQVGDLGCYPGRGWHLTLLPDMPLSTGNSGVN